MNIQELKELISELNPDALFIDGFDDAIIGITERHDIGALVVYSEEKIINKLIEDMDDDGEDEKELMAIEYYEYNILGSWVGENGPLIVKDRF